MRSILILEAMGYIFAYKEGKLTYAFEGTIPPPEAANFLNRVKAERDAAVRFLCRREHERRAEASNAQIWEQFASNVRISEALRTRITKAIKAAASPFELLMLALECISLMSGDNLFYDQNRENIKTVYGAGLSDPAPMEIELAEVRQRLAMLTRPELDNESQDNRRRIDHAIKAHRAREAQLLDMIGDAAVTYISRLYQADTRTTYTLKQSSCTALQRPQTWQRELCPIKIGSVKGCGVSFAGSPTPICD